MNPQASSDEIIVASGVAAAHIPDILRDLGLWDAIAFYHVVQPYPLHADFLTRLLDGSGQILVIEETTGVMEGQFGDRHKIRGKRDGFVPRVGELTPDIIQGIVARFAGVPDGLPQPAPPVPGRRPTLCAGCPHRASFFAIKTAAPKGIYTSDIGCYTLGLNFGAVDTVLCMGAAISQAAGFHHAYKNREKPPDIVATLGDSTFFHAGIPALIDAVNQNVRFTLVILDNRTTAMTGGQPTPATGLGATGAPLTTLSIESIVEGCGVGFLRVADPYDMPAFTALLREAVAYGRTTGPAVVIARHPCLLDRRQGEAVDRPVRVDDACDGCGFCVTRFECPALSLIDVDEKRQRAHIDPLACSHCGVCVHVCPKGRITAVA